MKGRDEKGRHMIKNTLFPPSLFAVFLGVLFLMSGIHVGLIVMMNERDGTNSFKYWYLCCIGELWQWG